MREERRNPIENCFPPALSDFIASLPLFISPHVHVFFARSFQFNFNLQRFTRDNFRVFPTHQCAIFFIIRVRCERKWEKYYTQRSSIVCTVTRSVSSFRVVATSSIVERLLCALSTWNRPELVRFTSALIARVDK